MKQKIARKILTVTSMLLSGVMVTATVICNENATAISSALNVKTFDVVETGDTNQDSEYYKSNFDTLTDLINAGHSKATEVLEEGAVLLKNENGALPHTTLYMAVPAPVIFLPAKQRIFANLCRMRGWKSTRF